MKRLYDADERIVRRPLGFRADGFVVEDEDPVSVVSSQVVTPSHEPPDRNHDTPPWAGRRK